MRLRAAVAVLALAIGGVGCGDDSDPPDLGLAAAEEAYDCLGEEGFQVAGTRTPNDRDGADVELTVRPEDVPIVIAYYPSEAEARRRERALVKDVAPEQGTVLIRGSVAIVTGGLPDEDDKAIVESCVF